jgi:ATP-dependent Clp protease ATP-binding subunit ClpB
MEHLARIGYDPAFGARPLKRAIQQYIETPLSKKIIAGEIKDGNHVWVEPSDKGFSFEVKEVQAVLN